MKTWRLDLIAFVFLIISVILQASPFGIPIYTLHLGNYEVRLHSYFSLYPFLYYNFAPMISAVASVIAMVIFLSKLITNRQAIILKCELICILIAEIGAVISFIISVTFVSGIVAGLLTAIFLLQMIHLKKLIKIKNQKWFVYLY